MVIPPPKPSEERDTVPTAMDDVVATGLAKQPTDRYRSTVEMAAAARQAVTAPTQPLRERSPASPIYPYPATAPTQFGGPPQLPPPAPPAGKPPGRRRGVLIGAVVAVVLLIAGGVVVGLRLTRHHNPVAAAPPPPSAAAAPAPNTGPFTGTYRAEFGPATTLGDVPKPGPTVPTGTYAVRSLCRPTGCVATTRTLSGDPGFASTLVFDQVGENWVAVAVAPGKCNDGPAETWQVFTLQPRPDGTLVGAHMRTAANNCAEKRTVTFTRTGDVDVNTLPDPVGVRPRVVSPAEALHGRYRLNRTFTSRLPQQQSDEAVTTYCLRTGDRCTSYFYGETTDTPLVFSGDNWVLSIEREFAIAGCGAPTPIRTSGQYPLPQPLQNPITLLTGHGHHEQSGTCAMTLEFDETYTCTGD